MDGAKLLMALRRHGVDLSESELEDLQDRSIIEADCEAEVPEAARDAKAWLHRLEQVWGPRFGKDGETHLRVTYAGRARKTGRSLDLSQRAAAFEHAVACIVGADEGVRDFRETCLGWRSPEDSLLTLAAANAFVRSPALRLVRWAALQEHGVPLLAHTARVEHEGRERDGDTWRIRYVLRVDPPGVTLDYEYSHTNETYRAGDGFWFIGGSSQRDLLVWPMPGDPSPDEAPSLREHLERHQTLFLPVVLGSVVDWLRNIAEGFCRLFPWEVPAAMLFILTGEVPRIAPVRGQWSWSRHIGEREHSVIRLQIEPWVPADYVHETYRTIQQQMLATKKTRDREPGERSLAVFRFVMERAPYLLNQGLKESRTEQGEKALTWGDLMKEWDATWKREDWLFGRDRAGFWRAFRRWKDILFPSVPQAVFEQPMPGRTVLSPAESREGEA